MPGPWFSNEKYLYSHRKHWLWENLCYDCIKLLEQEKKRERLQNKPYWIRPKIYYIMPKKKHRNQDLCIFPYHRNMEANTKCYKKWPKGENILGSGTRDSRGSEGFHCNCFSFWIFKLFTGFNLMITGHILYVHDFYIVKFIGKTLGENILK